MSAAATPSDTTPPPGRFAFILGVIRRLIDFGTDLATTFRQSDTAAAYVQFGADTVPAILARIARGLLRAQVLQERLQRLAALPERKPRATPTARQPRGPRPPPSRLVATAPDPVQPPTAGSIAAEDRRRPIGAVLADICRDLGIVPAHDLWRDLTRAVGQHRGNVTALFNDALARLFESPGWQAAMRAAFPQQTPPEAAATGPP